MKVGVGLQGQGRYLDRLLWLNPDATLILQEGIEDARWLCAHGWEGEVWLRFYDYEDNNPMGTDPEVYAARIQQWLVENEYGVDIKHIIPWNELNLACEHKGIGVWDSVEAYIAINQWCCRCLLSLRELLRDKYILHWGALSPGHEPPGYEPEYEYNLVAASVRYADMVDMHVYGPTELEWTGSGRAERIVAKLNQMGVLTKNIAITEVNSVDYVELLSWLKAYIPDLAAIFWFLWCGNPEHSAFDLIKQDLEPLKAFIEKNKEVSMAEFRYGVKDEADKLRLAGIDPGQPLSDEYWFLHDLAVQPTTTGTFWIYKVQGTFYVQFFPKALGG
jgi:hypothetical protein